MSLIVADTLTLNDSIKNDQDWLTNESVMFVLEFCGYNATEEQANQIRDEYFTPEQLGDYLAMIPGLIDVSLFMHYIDLATSHWHYL